MCFRPPSVSSDTATRYRSVVSKGRVAVPTTEVMTDSFAPRGVSQSDTLSRHCLGAVH